VADFLLRDMAPLTPEEWASIDRAVEDTARHVLVGRRFIHIHGPLGAGVQAIPVSTYAAIDGGVIDFVGREQALVSPEVRRFQALPLVYRDFLLHWRDIEASRQFGIPLELGAAMAAAAFVAQREDDLIFNGNVEIGFSGLLQAEGRNTIPMGNWRDAGVGFNDVVAATQRLVSARFFGPYALVLSPQLYAAINRIHDGTGVLEIEQIAKLMADGVHQSPILPEPTAVVISSGPQNMDLVIALDLSVAYLQVENLNHYFRVMEILLPRIKRPGAICAIEPQGGQPAEERRRRREGQGD